MSASRPRGWGQTLVGVLDWLDCWTPLVVGDPGWGQTSVEVSKSLSVPENFLETERPIRDGPTIEISKSSPAPPAE